jgi:peptidoglycan/LPS O-acetylase OafA/YrhL
MIVTNPQSAADDGVSTDAEAIARSHSSQRRFTTIDALRGLAAFAVAFYHLNVPLHSANADWAPPFVMALISRGNLGVDVFFVISGFVIAHSIRDGNYTWGYLGRFAARRSIRLDPPYWLTIILETFLVALSFHFFPLLTTPKPTLAEIASNFVYMQNLLQQGNVLGIFWTLCYEVQFYFFLVAFLVLWHSARPHLAGWMKRAGPYVFFALLFAYSVGVRYKVLPAVPEGLAIDRWYEFFCGMLTYWTVRGRTSSQQWTAALVFLSAVVLLTGHPGEEYVSVIVSVFLLVSVKTGFLERALARTTFQFLGKISYSVYLLHLPIGTRFVSLIRTLNHGHLSILGAWVTLAFALILTTIAATLMWWAVESPTMRLSKRITLNRAPRVESRAPVAASSPA